MMTDHERAEELLKLLEALIVDVSDCSGIECCEAYCNATERIGALR